jgi:very-short-patch-repair endonuclease
MKLMSYIATQVQNTLEELFPAKPFKQVFCEYYINYKGQKLFFDFHIKKLNVVVEVQGQQHTKFVKHFHGTRQNFLKQKERDNLKRIWAEEEDVVLVRFNYDEKITKKLVLYKIDKAMKDGFYE